MTQYIDRHDADAVKRKAEREVRALAGAEVAKAAFDLAGQKDKAVVEARLKVMIDTIVEGLDALQTQALKDLDALAIEVEDFG